MAIWRFGSVSYWKSNGFSSSRHGVNCRRGCSSVWSKELSAGPGDTTNRSSKQSHALAIVSTSLAAVLPTKTSPFDSDSPSLLYGSAYLQAIYPPPAEATSASSHPPQVKTSSAAPVIPSVFPPSQLKLVLHLPQGHVSPPCSSLFESHYLFLAEPVFLEAEGGLGTLSWVACKLIPRHSYSRCFQEAEHTG